MKVLGAAAVTLTRFLAGRPPLHRNTLGVLGPALLQCGGAAVQTPAMNDVNCCKKCILTKEW